jgi:hypothetical protein
MRMSSFAFRQRVDQGRIGCRPRGRSHRWSPPETLRSTAGRNSQDDHQRQQNCRRCCPVVQGSPRVPSPCPRRRSDLNTDAESAPGALVNQSGRTDQSVAPAKKKAVGAKPKAARAAKPTKDPRPPRSSRAESREEKLVCRYCGSDDLAPSFRKRRDARCRACFKKRYGSAPQHKKTARTRKTKAAK